jgi:hypothetical protein
MARVCSKKQHNRDNRNQRYIFDLVNKHQFPIRAKFPRPDRGYFFRQIVQAP